MAEPTGSGRIGDFWAIVPAGGAGTRLWPLSRASSPKFLHDLTGSGRSLLQATVDRLEPLCANRIAVVTGQAQAAAVRLQLQDRHQVSADLVLAEPASKDSMPAIGLAAAVLERRDPAMVVGSFAADHVIDDVPAFHAAVRAAVTVARTGRVVTIGIEPTRAATAFGYIELGDRLDASVEEQFEPPVYQVRAFVEKPDAETAAAYLATGRFRWNAGMFVARVGVLMDRLAAYQPDLAAGLRAIAAEPARLPQLWPALTAIAIDHAVAEPAARDGLMAVVPADLGWDDIGDFASLAARLPGAGGIAVLGEAGQVLADGSTGVVVTGGRQVVVLGIADAVVVDTPDAVLVTTIDHAQRVKSVVDRLRVLGRTDLL